MWLTATEYKTKRAHGLTCHFMLDRLQWCAKPMNKIPRGNEHHLLIPIQSELASFTSVIVHWPQLYSLAKHARFCEPGVVTFSRRHLLFVCRGTCRRQLGKNLWGSRQLKMLTWFSLIWSLFQFLVIIDYFLGKKHRESKCSTIVSPNMWDFASEGFSRRHI